MSCNSDTASLCWVFILPMTSFHVHLVPTICFDQLNDIPDFHNTLSIHPSILFLYTFYHITPPHTLPSHLESLPAHHSRPSSPETHPGYSHAALQRHPVSRVSMNPFSFLPRRHRLLPVYSPTGLRQRVGLDRVARVDVGEWRRRGARWQRRGCAGDRRSLQEHLSREPGGCPSVALCGRRRRAG